MTVLLREKVGTISCSAPNFSASGNAEMSAWERLYRILVSICLSILGFSIGLGCSLIFYEFVLRETEFDDGYKMIMFGSVAIFLSIGFAFSNQIRCITFLTGPEFGSKAGKRTIQATILILVLAGPVENIGKNGEEVLRFMSCTKDMLWEIMITGKDLLLAPIQHIVFELRTDGAESKYNISQLVEIVDQISEEVEGETEILEIKSENDHVDEEMGHEKRSEEVESHYKVLPNASDADKIQTKYRKELAYRCEDVFSKGTEKCKEVFAGKYDECYEVVTVFLGWLLCWPMKLTFICDVIGMFAQDKVCDMTDVIEDGFGESYLAARKGIDDFTKSFKVRVDYQALSKLVNIEDLKATKDDVLTSFINSRKYVEYYISIVKRILAMSFLLIIFSALNYHGKYFQRLSFDNRYVTKYFRKIDARREAQQKSNLLPFKSFERPDFLIVIRISLTVEERKTFFVQLVVLVVEASVVSTLFLFDFIFTGLLNLVKNHADITVHQEGRHVLNIYVDGEGLLAQLLRNILKDIHVNKQIDITRLSKPCLPNANVLDPGYYQRTIILFSALFLMSYFEAHVMRIRHCFANYFYPKRSKKRTLWLYNDTLKKRKSQMSHLKNRILGNVEEQKINVNFNPIWALAETFPRLCACLRCFKFGRRKCILCKQYGEVYRCPDCGFSYCKECFEDVDLRCLYCIVRLEEKFEDEENEFNDKI